MKYRIEWTETNRRFLDVTVPDKDGLDEAKEFFWETYHDLNSDRFPLGQLVDTSEPQDLTVRVVTS